MSEQAIQHTFDAGVTASKKQKTKKTQNKNVKNKLSNVEKNKLVERILKDFENDGKVHKEDLDLNTSGILPIAKVIVPKNKLSNVKNIVSEQTMPCTLGTGVNKTKKKTKKQPKKNLKKNLSDIKKNKLIEELLKDWENDD
ncbi:uncharacterized protein LOC111033496 [Myzus persicae]|uniref:uncharacterized protein LOC111033496 n=1 Tax=Myzus persicae TaxID=13164 RepID=UPI000B932A5F|nr:uncharacterized protein LOC111033496 [Myzus persicae]